MGEKIITNNIAEALFHIRLGHNITDVSFQPTGQYSTTELVMAMEGQGIILDRRRFLSSGKGDLGYLFLVLDAIQSAVWMKQ